MTSIFLSLLLATTPADEAAAALALAKAQRERPRIALINLAVAPSAVPAKPAKAATHSHKCAACGTVWSHADDSFGKVADHTCPNCGHVQWSVYQRFAAPQPVRTAPAARMTFCPTGT